MSKIYKVELTNTAHEDLEDIVKYIANDLKEPAVARKFHMKIVDELKKLKVMPQRHALSIDIHLHSLNVRPFYIDNYIAPYTIVEEKNTVLVLRVLYARRDWQNLL